MTLRLAVAAPYKHTRKTMMRKNELIYYYALDRKWMSTEQANQLLKRAEEEGLLSLENGQYTPLFDLSGLTLPVVGTDDLAVSGDQVTGVAKHYIPGSQNRA